MRPSPVATEVQKCLHTTRVVEAGADRGHDDHDCKFRASEMSEVCTTVILTLFLQDVQVRSFVVGGKSGGCDVGCPIPKVGLLGERPAVPGGREVTSRRPVTLETCVGWKACSRRSSKSRQTSLDTMEKARCESKVLNRFTSTTVDTLTSQMSGIQSRHSAHQCQTCSTRAKS